jgi:hypothetical protein
MVDLSDLTDFVLPLADQMATTVTDSINYHIDTVRGISCLHALHSTLIAARIDVTKFPAEATLIADRPDGVGANAMGNEAANFTDTRKVVLSLTSPLPFLDVNSLRKITIHMMPNYINPRFCRIYRVPKPMLGEGEVLPPKSIPNIQAALNRIDLVTGVVQDSTWTSSGLPLPKNHPHALPPHY